MSMFHLGWFGPNYGVTGWDDPGAPTGYDWTKPTLVQDMARALERGCIDLLIFEDSSAIPEQYGGNSEIYLKHAVYTPKMDPTVLVPYVAAVTRHIGIAPTMTANYYPPFLLARMLATMDHASGGRVAWNIVTATNEGTARNYGLDQHIEHDLRYDMADEFIDCCTALWKCWEPDAVVMDRESGMTIDYTKVHKAHFKGKYYKSEGPLNLPRSPQTTPVFVTPGGSARGRKFSGRNAEVVLAAGGTVEAMTDYVAEVRRNAESFGRSRDSYKVMFLATPVVVRNEGEAAEHRANAAKMRVERMERTLAIMSFSLGVDLKKYDLDGPVPDVKTNGLQTLQKRFSISKQKTLRQLATEPQGFEIVGTPDAIASQMSEMQRAAGHDGYLINSLFKPAYVSSIVDQLIPVLQKRGLTRKEYSGTTLRENLMAF